MNALLANFNPFSSELAPAMVNPESITAPDLTDRSVAVVANSVSDGVFSGSLPSGEIKPSVTLVCSPSDFNSVVTNTDTALDLEETPIPESGAVTNSSSCGSTESRRAVDRSSIRMSGRLDGLDDGFDAMQPIPQATAGVASCPQDSIPEPAQAPLPVMRAETAAGETNPPSPAAFFELLTALNTINHPCDLDALAAHLDKIDRNDPPPDRELLTFLDGEPPIYWPPIKPQPKLLRKIFELAGMPT